MYTLVCTCINIMIYASIYYTHYSQLQKERLCSTRAKQKKSRKESYEEEQKHLFPLCCAVLETLK